MPKSKPLTITILTAQQLTKEQRQLVERTIKNKVGQDATIEEQVDPSLLGGIQVRLGEQLYDASVSGKLERLQALQPLAIVSTARALTNQQRRRLQTGLATQLGREYKLKEVVNPQLLGGLRLTVDGREYDGTLRKSLLTLSHSLEREALATLT